MSLIILNIYKYIVLSRPVNVVIAFITIIIAAGISGPLYPFNYVILAALSASFITIGANVINDYFDIEIDRINKPKRLIPSGQISKQNALIFFMVSYLIGWILALLINIEMFLISLFSGLILILYHYKFKRVVLWGNFIVSFISGLVFIYGGMAVNRVNESLFPACFAFFFHFGREIIKDIQDIEGDKPQGAVTYPIKFGIRRSLILTNIIFVILIIFTIIPYLLGYYGIYFLLIVVIGVHSVLIFVIITGWSNPSPKNLGRLSTILKIDMLVGLFAIFMG